MKKWQSCLSQDKKMDKTEIQMRGDFTNDKRGGIYIRRRNC